MKKKIDRFKIEEVLSESGGGSVYRASEELPGNVTRPVALKVLLVTGNDSKVLKHFTEELRLLVSISGHPNIVTVYGMGITEEVPWIAMEYVQTTMHSSMSEQPAQSEQVAEMMRQVATALGVLHTLTPAVLHNDLAPSNILINRFGVYKITDFGLASPANIDRTRVMVTVRYASPELLSRELGTLSPATDLYALGHIAYELALGGKLYRQQFPAVYSSKSTGREGLPAAWMAWHCSMETKAPTIAEVRPESSKDLSDIISKLMNKRSSERYASVEELLGDLRKISPTAAGASAATAQPRIESYMPTSGIPATNEPTAGLPHKKADQYWVRLGGKTSGPYDVAKLQSLLKQGQISRMHKVSSDRVNWLGINSVEGLVWS